MKEQEWRFCVVGNIVRQHHGEDGQIFYGTKAFTGGTAEDRAAVKSFAEKWSDSQCPVEQDDD